MANNSANYNVNMRFTADTGQAKQQLSDLQRSIDKLMNEVATKDIKFFNATATKKEIADASDAVRELKVALDQATNVDTGRLDLSKFSKSISQSGYTLQDFANHLENLGPTGDKAFVQLAQSVINAEVPLKRTNAILDNFKKTLANTVKWQISSNMMHGVQGALQRAYYYAEDLNESLNNIRIVTGHNTDQMAKFAEQANKTAQALSTTTTNYTNSALIYYQQGLADDQVQKRTDTTIKMANVAGESATKVSDQLTAVWNNFYDGSKSLEYYADVMVKLGAYTASSTDEISAGIQKFASVADTIGLSYEYATSALATLTARTRESAETVGNSLKTLFARIQGLSLGETMDDGTDLNKYSKALATVGINVKDQNDELKDMNTILDEMMDKWDTLSRAQQVALAQTVGGVRQYTQLVNLMENKDYFKELVGVAKGSEGALQEQADIYAESWEASRKRVQASLEELYSNLVDDKFFIKMTDGLTDVINLVDGLVDSLGGVEGVIATVGTLMLKTFNKDIGDNITRMVSNMFIDRGVAENQASVMKKAQMDMLKEWVAGIEEDPQAQDAIAFETTTLVEATSQSYELQQASKSLNEVELQRLKTLKGISDAYAKIAINAKKQAEEASVNAEQSKRDAYNRIFGFAGENGGAHGVQLGRYAEAYTRNQVQQYREFMSSSYSGENDASKIAERVNYLELSGERYQDIQDLTRQYYDKISHGEATGDLDQKIISAYKTLRSEYADTSKQAGILTQYTDNLLETQAEQGEICRQTANALKPMFENSHIASVKVAEMDNSTGRYGETLEAFNERLKNSQIAVQTTVSSFVNLAQGIGSCAMAVNSFKGIIDTLNNTDMTFGEKFLSIMTSLSFAIPSVISGLNMVSQSIGNIHNNWSQLGNGLASLITGLSNIQDVESFKTKLAELSSTGKETTNAFKILTKGQEAFETASASGASTVEAGTQAMQAMGKAVGLTALKFAGIAIVIASVVALLVHLNKVEQSRTTEAQLERATQASENLEKQLTEVKNRAEEIVDAFQEYDKIKQTLDNCTVGTQKWRDTLSQANEEALNILKTYPELAKIEGAWGKSSNGEIWVDTSYLDQVKSIYDQQASILQYSSARNEANIGRLKVQQLTENLTDTFGEDASVSAGVNVDDTHLLKGWNNGSVMEVQYRELIPLIAQNIDKFQSNMPKELLKDNLVELFNEQGWMASGDGNIESVADTVATQLMENGTSLDNLNEAIRDNTNSIAQATKEATIQQALGLEQMSTEESKITSALVDANVEALKNLYSTKGGALRYKANDGTLVDIGTYGENYGGTSQGSQALKNLWDRYLEAIGQTGNDEYKLDVKNSVKGDGQHRYFNFADPNHEKVYLSEVLDVVATADAMAEDLNSTYDKAIQLLNTLQNGRYTDSDNNTKSINGGSTVGKGIAEFLGNQDLGGLTEAELTSYITNLKKLGEEGLNDVFAQGLFGKDFNLLTDEEKAKLKEQMSALGIESYDAFVKSQEEEAVALQSAVGDIYSDKFFKYILGKDENKPIKSTLTYFDKYSNDLKLNLTSMLKDAFSSAGFEGVQALAQAINSAGEDLTKEDLEQIQSVFESSTDVDDFITQLKTLGLITDDGVEAWTNYYNAMTKVGNNLPITQFEDFRQILSDIIDLLNGEIGSVVSQEDIDKLEKLGLNWQKYFVQTGPDEYTQTQEYTTEDKNKMLGASIGQMEENGQYALNNEDRILNQKSYVYDGSNYTLSDLVSALSAEGATQAKGSLITSIANVFGGVDNLAKFTNLDADNFDQTVFGQKTAQEQASFIQGIIDAFDKNKNYVDDIYSSKVESYANAGSVLEANQLAGFRENGQISKAGADGLRAWASLHTDIDGVIEANNEYNSVLNDTTSTVEEIQRATEKYYDALRDAEVKNKINEIKDIKGNIEDLEESGKDTTSEMNKLYSKVKDLFNLSEDDFNNNKDLINKFLFGTEDEQQLAGEELEKLKDQGEQAGKAYGQAVREEAQSAVNSPIDFSQMQSSMQTNLSQIMSMLQQDNQFQITGQMSLDTSQAISALAPLDGTVSDMCGYINALGQAGIHFNTSQLKQLFTTFAKIKQMMNTPNVPPSAIMAESNKLSNMISVFSQNSRVPQNKGKRDYTTTVDGDNKGGGGGSSSSKSVEDIGKEIADKQISVKEKKRELLEAKRENLNPNDAQEYIKQEIDLLEEEQQILEKQIKTWKTLLKTKVAEFNAKHPELEITLDDNGEIANASELWGKVWAQYEQNMENGMSKEELNEWFSKLSDDISGPMGIQENIDENVSAIAQKEKEQAELELESITKAIDWKVKQIDYQIKRLNYYQEKLLTQAHGNKQTIEAMLEGFAYQEQEMLQLFDKGATLREGIDQLNSAKQKYPDQVQMFDEQILEYQGDLIDVNQSILELRQNIEDLVQDVMDLALDEIDKQIERLDTYTSMLDHLNNIIDLSGRSMLDMGLKTQIGATKVETMIGKMKSLKDQMDGLSKAQKEAEQALADRRVDGDETSVKFWENQVEVIKQEVEKASDEFLASWEETLQSAQELFELRVQMAVNTLSNALSPFETLEQFQDQYEKAKTINEEYLDDAERIYELNKLNRQLNLQLNDASDILAKEKLKAIQQEINDLQADGVQMSQYDLEYLQKKYDLQLAEIALMEQQNSKTSMRLVRDASGNWTYAYDADEEKIEDATQKYEDAVYELGQLSKEYINDVSEQLIQNQIDFKEALQDLDKNSADYSNQLLALQEYYVERQRYLLDELNKGVENSGQTFHDTLYGQMTDLYDYNDAYMMFVNNSNTTISDLQTNYKDWQKVVESAMNVAGTSWDSFGTDMGGTLDTLEEHIQKLCDEIEELVNVLMGYISQSIGMVNDWEQKYSKRTDEEIAKNESYIDGNFGFSAGSRYNTVGVDLSAIAMRMANGETNIRDANGNLWTSVSQVMDARQEKLGRMEAGNLELRNNSSDTWTSDEQKQITSEKTQKWLQDQLDKITGSGASSGAYTGDWSAGEGLGMDNGKIIKVHPKELILNKDDTSNLLSAIGLVRQMNNWIDDQVKSIIGLGASKLDSLTSSAVPASQSTQDIQQEVHIDASFPNVVDHYEIEEALSNLANDASQYISTKRLK